MYLHLGEDTVVRSEEMIGIFDMDQTTISRHTREFLAQAQKNGRVVTVSPELPRSFVICHHPKEGTTVYICQISAATLRKRAGQIRSSGKTGEERGVLL